MVRSEQAETGKRTARDYGRSSVRWPLDARILVVQPVSASGMAFNVSSGGIRVALNRELRVGMRCKLRIERNENNVTYERARVVWSQRKPDGFVYGLEFLAS